MVVQSDTERFIISNSENKELIEQRIVAFEPYQVSEPFPQIKWQLSSETKKVGGFLCQKATGAFRGRSYTIWFTTEIPIKAAPWKLFGAPGLVLEFYDDSRQIYCVATHIELSDKYNLPSIIGDIPKKGEKLDIKKYVALKKDENITILKKVMAQYGSRDAKIDKIEPQKRKGYELTYEWEEN